MNETKRINATFSDTPRLGDLFISDASGGRLIPRYRVTKIGKTVRLQGVDRDLDFIVSVTKNARHSFKRIDAEVSNEL